jgi:hypothetical protein
MKIISMHNRRSLLYKPIIHIVDFNVEEYLQKLYNKLNICKFLSSKTLEWTGHVLRAEGCLIRKVLDGNLNGKRPIGRPRQRWFNTVRKDLT